MQLNMFWYRVRVSESQWYTYTPTQKYPGGIICLKNWGIPLYMGYVGTVYMCQGVKYDFWGCLSLSRVSFLSLLAGIVLTIIGFCLLTWLRQFSPRQKPLALVWTVQSFLAYRQFRNSKLTENWHAGTIQQVVFHFIDVNCINTNLSIIYRYNCVLVLSVHKATPKGSVEGNTAGIFLVHCGNSFTHLWIFVIYWLLWCQGKQSQQLVYKP